MEERGKKKVSKLNLTEEEKEKLRKLEVLDLKLLSLAVELNRENAIDALADIGIDLEECIRKTRNLMRRFVTAREQYVEVSE